MIARARAAKPKPPAEPGDDTDLHAERWAWALLVVAVIYFGLRLAPAMWRAL